MVVFETHGSYEFPTLIKVYIIDFLIIWIHSEIFFLRQVFLGLPPTISFSVILLIFSSVLWLWMRIRRNPSHKKPPPQAGGAWPVLGHLRLLGGPEPPHLVLCRMADNYGPFFSIKLGVHRAVVINNHELAKECLKTNDSAFASRPKTLAMEVLGYNFAMFAISTYGDYWRHARKMFVFELLSNHRLDSLVSVRESEVTESVKQLYQRWSTNKDGSNQTLVEMKRWFADVTLNMTLRIVAGKRVTELSGRWKKALKDFIELSGKFVLADALPYLRWLDITGDEKVMKRTARELDDVVEAWLREHKQKRLSGAAAEHQDFMDDMLSIVDQPSSLDFSHYDKDTFVKAMCMAFVVATPDTIAVTLTWALSLLLNNPDVLNKAQQELDEKFGGHRHKHDKPELIREANAENLPYLQAIIKETLRLYPAAPLSLPHESLKDCTINGYDVSAGTRLVINLTKIQRDPRVWIDPNEFRPERFMTTCKDTNVKGQNFELIPFSSGRRMCPGVSLGLRVLGLLLANLLHGFDFATSEGGPVDMEESIGLTNNRANPLNVFISPRFTAYKHQ